MVDPRGIRNKNPTNIRKTDDQWQGLSEVQSDPFFCVFDDAVYGIRAAIKTFWTYQDKYNLNSIAQLIKRWAPPSENKTDSYADAVSRGIGVSKDCTIDLHNLNICLPFVKAVIHQECGSQPYPDDLIQKAFNLAKAQ